MKKICISLGIVLILCLISLKLYRSALQQAEYLGLPTVPCQDYTLPIKQNYSLTIKISINKHNYPLSPTIGHDFGKCLHEVFTSDASGKVFIKANDTNKYTLGQFFDVWHTTFNQQQLFGYQASSSHHITVMVNGKEVNTNRSTPLSPNSTMQVIYQ